MRTYQEYADHLRTTGAWWEMGQRNTDFWIMHADRMSEIFCADRLGGKLPAQIKVAGLVVGLADPETLDYHRWPTIDEDPLDHAGSLHRHADTVKTVGLCYFIGGDAGAIKIGFSVDVPGRLRAIASCSPVPLTLLATAPGGQHREAAYHEQFAAYRLHGEWFERCPEIEAEIARLSGAAA